MIAAGRADNLNPWPGTVTARSGSVSLRPGSLRAGPGHGDWPGRYTAAPGLPGQCRRQPLTVQAVTVTVAARRLPAAARPGGPWPAPVATGAAG